MARFQNPEATFIAPLKRWNELGRIVNDKAIFILTPVFKNIENTETGEVERKVVKYYRVPVYDYSSTKGKELPIERIRLKLEGESEEAIQIFNAAKLIAESNNCSVSVERVPGAANGYFFDNGLIQKIVIDRDLSINHRAKTIIV
ncbi:hypothetical protein J2S17_003126 [Cytobacillus purgationiresistens]|uniref:Uncharacterized protein n=1 Tax=Cytobacillus purgationiresistens TaxID=863449 RepID=A0ABU0AIZ6_9BACI|nr:hypothetical protein [Cytobacillus purgationiresistens]